MKNIKEANYIKRISNAIKADVLFQFKHGFYFIYIIISLIYIIVISLFDQDIIKIAILVVVFIDPSILGLFFIGGMVLLEKEQGIIALLYITPLRIGEYIFSKLLTLSIISIITGVIITSVIYTGKVKFLLLIIGILLTSIFFTLIGFIVSTNSKTVNDYFVKIVPWMLIMIIPCFLLIPNTLIPKIINNILMIIPSVAGLKIVIGAFYNLPILEIIFYILHLIAINVLLFIWTNNLFKRRVILNK